MGDFRQDIQGEVKIVGPASINWASVAINTKSAYTEISASTPIEASSFVIDLTGYENTGQNSIAHKCLVDLAIGPIGQEVIIAPNLTIGKPDAIQVWNNRYEFPLPIKKGTRLSFRMQSSYASIYYVAATIMLQSSSFSGNHGLTIVDAMGADLSDSGGLLVGNLLNAWQTVDASTAHAYKGFILASHNTTSSYTNTNYLIDVAAGASNDQLLLEGFFSRFSGYENSAPQVSPYIPTPIAKGAKITARGSDTSDTVDVIIYGVR